ncbi:MAG: hypothetical protein ACYC6A_09380 [Armatimonadota bacterium]
METGVKPAPRRRLPRWAWALIILALLVGGWYFAGRLHPITIRTIPADCYLHFSMGGCGYPAVEGSTDKGRRTYDYTARWLDDDGRPQGEPFVLHSGKWAVSPGRIAVAHTMAADKRNEVGIAWRDGRRTRLTLPRPVSKLLPTADDGRFQGSGQLFDLQGMAAFTPPMNLEFAGGVQSVDPRYVVLRHWSSTMRLKDLILYDTAGGKRVWTTTRSVWQAGIVFHAGNDFLFVPREGLAQRFTGSVSTGSAGTPTGRALPWWWGEDGTVWTVQAGSVQVLDWQHGALRLRKLPVISTEDPRVRRLENRAGPDSLYYIFPSPPHEPSSGVAVWGGGRLVAVAASRSIWPAAIQRAMQPIIKRYRTLQRERRVLTLYHNGRKIGRYAIPLDPNAVLEKEQWLAVTPPGTGYESPVLAREHLAFTKDGTRLAWVVETAKGKTIYVFKVPR